MGNFINHILGYSKYEEEIALLKKTIKVLNDNHELALKEREKELTRARDRHLEDERRWRKQFEEYKIQEEAEKNKMRAEFKEHLDAKERQLEEIDLKLTNAQKDRQDLLVHSSSELAQIMNNLRTEHRLALKEKDEDLKRAHNDIVEVKTECREELCKLMDDITEISSWLEQLMATTVESDMILAEVILRLQTVHRTIAEIRARPIFRTRRESEWTQTGYGTGEYVIENKLLTNLTIPVKKNSMVQTDGFCILEEEAIG